MSEISFTELMKLIHPDTNPEIADPGEKMIEAGRFRDDPKALYKLAVRWGLKEDAENIGRENVEYFISEGKDINIDGVRHIAVEVKNNQSGIEVVALNTHSGRFLKFQKIDKYDQDSNFYVTGFTPPEEYFDIDYKYQAMKAGVKV